jgi:hypothetical protein
MEIAWSKSYWVENFAMSVAIATKHTNLLKLITPVIVVFLAVLGVSIGTQNIALRVAAGIPAGIAAYLLFLMLFVTPMRIWRDMRGVLEPKIEFIEHADNIAFEQATATDFVRVTVRNASATVPLTNCSVNLMSLEPIPAGFMTFNLPMNPMHDLGLAHTFTLTPRAHQTIDVLSKTRQAGSVASLWHRVDFGVPREVPDGRYRALFEARANETVPTQQFATVVIESVSGRFLDLSLDKPKNLT